MFSKKKALTLTIPEPCGENFNEMTPVKGGKFCGECEKTIVDFRTMNDYQILRFYEQNNGKICGVFKPQQLNRAMPFPMEVAPAKNWKAVAALTAGLLFSGGLASQTTIPTVGKIAVTTQTVNKAEQQKESTTPNQIIKGRVMDEIGEQLIGTNIIIEGTTIGTTTDIDGSFELIVPANLKEMEVTVSYTGYAQQTLLFNEKYPIPNEHINIILTGGIELGEVVVIADNELEKPMIMGGIMAISEIEANHETAPITIEEETIPPTLEIKVYPNPFIAKLNISYEYDTKGDYLFHLYDLNGRLLFAKTYNLLNGKQSIELDMASKNLDDGIYILQISDTQDRILVTKKVYKGRA